jgi:formylglycine-generating enzyme required for sulfatase activity
MAMERYEVHGVKVYQLNICEAIQDHHLCTGITTLVGNIWQWTDEFEDADTKSSGATCG